MDGRKLAAALLVCLCFGAIHAYGVLMVPIEQWLGTSRTVASLGYAIALAALTAGVWLNGQLANAVSPRLRFLGCGAFAAAGLLLAPATSSALALLVGFGVMFGLANGLAYALALSVAAAAMPGRDARAMGLATAAYGLGAVLTSQVFAAALHGVHVAVLLLLLAPVVLVACVVASSLVGDGVAGPAQGRQVSASANAQPLQLLWAAYLLGAFAGLMALAHAPAIAAWRNDGGGNAGLVAGIVSLGSVAGGYLGGVTAERLPGRGSLAIPVLMQAAALAVLPFLAGQLALLTLLGIVGLCYGVLIAAVPAEVQRIAGPHHFAASYGMVFTAWGIAGVAGPVIAGSLYDATHGYGAALAAASGLSLLSCLLVMRMPRGTSPALSGPGIANGQ